MATSYTDFLTFDIEKARSTGYEVAPMGIETHASAPIQIQQNNATETLEFERLLSATPFREGKMPGNEVVLSAVYFIAEFEISYPDIYL